jgi:hypothetical protein
VAAEALPRPVRAAHADVKVARDAACDREVQAGVDEVRTALEGLHSEAALAQGRHDAEGDSGLAAAGVCPGDEDGRELHSLFDLVEQEDKYHLKMFQNDDQSSVGAVFLAGFWYFGGTRRFSVKFNDIFF